MTNGGHLRDPSLRSERGLIPSADSLASQIRCRLPGDLPRIAVVGPAARDMAAALRQVGYASLWVREEADAVLSLYHPGRLFDCIVLAGCLEKLNDMNLAFDQIDASLVPAGMVGVSAASTFEAIRDLFASHGFSVDVAQGPADSDPRMIGVFSRRHGP